MTDIDQRQEDQRLNEIADRERQTAINEAEAGSEPAALPNVSDSIPPATDETAHAVAPVEPEPTTEVTT